MDKTGKKAAKTEISKYELEYWLLLLEMQIAYEKTGIRQGGVMSFGGVFTTMYMMYIRCGDFGVICRQCYGAGKKEPCGRLIPKAYVRELPDSPPHFHDLIGNEGAL